MFHRRVVSLLSLALCASSLLWACAHAPVAPAPLGSETPPAAAPVQSAHAVPTPASSAASVAASCPPGQALAPDGSCAVTPPCIDGEVLMGACICATGKGVDATGHCVFMPCPRSTSGGTVFRNDAGQCVECRAGAIRSGDGCLK